MNVKHLLRSNKYILNCASFLCRLLALNRKRIKGKYNSITTSVPGLFLLRSRIKVVGNSNVIIFKPSISWLKNIDIIVHGNNNIIELGEGLSCDGLRICIEDDNNKIILGDKFRCGHNTELAAIEGTVIQFGNDCMLSANISVRTGDSHSVINASGCRINQSKSVFVGDHTWIGNTVLMMKGVNIEGHSIVASGSVVTGKNFTANCIIGGNPATIIKENVDWLTERI